jgi:HAD superfamily hydrolase (TIGR01549 family)
MKLIIFDFDGTLADTRELIVKTMQQTISALELSPRTDEQCASMIGLPLKQAFMDLIPMNDETGNLCVNTYRHLFATNNATYQVPPFPHVIETLRLLAEKGYTLSIASSRSRTSLLEFIRCMKIDDIITYVLGADDVKHAKPHPEPVIKTLHRFGCKAEEALVVGDMTYDIEMGRNAGVRTCGVTYGNGSRKELLDAGADYLIDNIQNVINIS